MIPPLQYTIFIAGDVDTIRATCRQFCLRGLCVTVTPTEYIFTGGSEFGAAVGLINYPRFPSTPEWLRDTSLELAWRLLQDCCQRSCTVQMPTEVRYLENPDLPAR